MLHLKSIFILNILKHEMASSQWESIGSIFLMGGNSYQNFWDFKSLKLWSKMVQKRLD